MRRSLILAAVVGALAFPVGTAQAHYGDLSVVNQKYYNNNFAGGCGAGTTWYCAKKGSHSCAEKQGNHYRVCYGYYTRGPGWPVTSKTNCKTTALYDHDHNTFSRLSNTCWS